MVYLDDSIMQKGEVASAGSTYLEGFAAPFDAEVIARLRGEDFARIKLGEFGMEEPEGELPLPMLANDVFGFVRRKAASYIRPTYGTVSRYGLVPTASSMDQIGVACSDLDEGFALLSRIAGKDEKDGAMLPETSYAYEKKGGEVRFAVPDAGTSPEVKAFAEKHGAAVVKLPYVDLYEQVLMILAYSEISNNISRYDGVKFGRRASEYKSLGELYTKSRTEGFGLPAKTAAIMGSMLLSEGCYEKYYVQAMKLRRMIKQSIRFAFTDHDALILAAGSPLAVLAGLPSVSKGGVELAAGACGEGLLRKAWEVARA